MSDQHHISNRKTNIRHRKASAHSKNSRQLIDRDDNIASMAQNLQTDASSLSPEDVVQLQRTIGNHATATLLQRAPQRRNTFSNLKMAPPDTTSGHSGYGQSPNVIQREDYIDDDVGSIKGSNAMDSIGDDSTEDDVSENQTLSNNTSLSNSNDNGSQPNNSNGSTPQLEYQNSLSDIWLDLDQFEQYDEEEELQKGLDSLASQGYETYYQDHDSGGNTYRRFELVLKHLRVKVIEAGEGAIDQNQFNLVKLAVEKGSILGSALIRLSEKSPQILAIYNEQRDEQGLATYSLLYDIVSKDDPRSTSVDANQLFKIRKLYNGNLALTRETPPNFDVFKQRVESPAWSWILSPSIKSVDDMEDTLFARQEYLISQDVKGNKETDKVESVTSTGRSGGGLIANVFTIADGVESIEKISKGVSAGSVLGGIMEDAAMWITGKAFAGLALGGDLIRTFMYQRRRKNAYRTAMDTAGIDKSGNTNIAPDSKENMEKIRLGKVAYYAWKKTQRGFTTSMIKMMLKIVKWIAYAITLLSGGTTAAVTGVIALSADISRALISIGQKVKGIIKSVTGKRGANRKKNATELVNLAKNGNMDALQTIIDVYPFDESKKLVNPVLNKFGGNITALPAPKDVDEFRKSWLSGHYSDKKVQDKLVIALSNTMKSK